MTPGQQVIAGVVSLLVMALIIELVRRRKLREEYSILWLAGGLLMVLTAVHTKFVNWLAGILGIQHPAYSVFVLALFVGLVLAVHFTVVLSKLTAQNWRLTQEIALLRTELDKLRGREESE